MEEEEASESRKSGVFKNKRAFEYLGDYYYSAESASSSNGSRSPTPPPQANRRGPSVPKDYVELPSTSGSVKEMPSSSSHLEYTKPTAKKSENNISELKKDFKKSCAINSDDEDHSAREISSSEQPPMPNRRGPPVLLDVTELPSTCDGFRKSQKEETPSTSSHSEDNVPSVDINEDDKELEEILELIIQNCKIKSLNDKLNELRESVYLRKRDEKSTFKVLHRVDNLTTFVLLRGNLNSGRVTMKEKKIIERMDKLIKKAEDKLDNEHKVSTMYRSCRDRGPTVLKDVAISSVPSFIKIAGDVLLKK